MELFLKLEAGYLVIATFALMITIFVSTRKFVPKGLWKKSVPFMIFIMAFFIASHYYVTSNRISNVESAFNNNKKVLCENRVVRRVSQSVTVEKSNEWSLNNHLFSSPNYNRDFFTARCIVHSAVSLELN